ncbi:SpoIIE family protein phosphatase [Streptomyces sp. NBC_00887]|uniref:SpoIIE family protein phosphatase n=1 Tax=Streptomyces sp. NBC_00887 TaxID=2975859 RepID=UPI00386DEAF9|nr:serine/threonine-protein phosphatase [Streptomyces sp. NBC_00887]WSY35767.1 serine/threonine-protein phosphatase [Streptomyces sp. NBC_00887]
MPPPAQPASRTPPPPVRQPDGTVDVIDEVLGVPLGVGGGVPLGVGGGVPLGVGGFPFRTTETDLQEGSVLALYTDGLVEAGEDISEGTEALRSQLARAAGELEATAENILTSMLPSAPTDDTVIVLARASRSSPHRPGRAV